MIYFDIDKNAYGYAIETPICIIEDDLWEQYCATDKWDIIDGIFTDISDTPEYKEKEKQREKERIGNLQITKRVLALALQELGITYTQLKELISTSEQAQLEWDLCVELQRKNPLLDIMAAQMGISSKMLDYIFQKANGEDVEPPTGEE